MPHLTHSTLVFQCLFKFIKLFSDLWFSDFLLFRLTHEGFSTLIVVLYYCNICQLHENHGTFISEGKPVSCALVNSNSASSLRLNCIAIPPLII